MAERGNWKNTLEFLFSCIGCLVGFGNIWRFPYLCYKNGGGAFLIPYFFFVFVLGLPLFFIEMSYTQFSNLGPGRAWICCPLFKGIGFGMVTLTGIVSIYYAVILAWTLYYLIMSFSKTLPWSSCNNPWNTDACFTRLNPGDEEQLTPVLDNSAVFQINMTHNILQPTSTSLQTNMSFFTGNVRLATEEFWEHNVLELTDGVGNPGSLRWQLLLCLLGGWLIVFLCLIKGIKSSGKVMYVAATVPYLLLLVLLIRGATLPGAWEGLKFYSTPRLEKLLTFAVWRDAAIQMFFSAGLGWGGIATLASYNDFHNNLQRDAILLPVLDGLTSWFAGCVIFVNLGYMAHATGNSLDNVVKEGPGIAFMVYPEALTQLPLPQLWSVLFFFMLFTVGMDSQIGYQSWKNKSTWWFEAVLLVYQFCASINICVLTLHPNILRTRKYYSMQLEFQMSNMYKMVHVQTLTGVLLDCFPAQLMRRKLLVTAAVCVTCMLLGLSCITQGGMYVLQILDWYVASISLMLLVFLEVAVLSWVYGVRRLYADIEMMLGFKLWKVWMIMWKFVTPVIILTIWVVSLVGMSDVQYGSATYPRWAISIGWIVAFLPVLPLPLNVLVVLSQTSGTLLQRIYTSVKPDPKWGPAKPELREQYGVPMERSHTVSQRHQTDSYVVVNRPEIEMTSLINKN